MPILPKSISVHADNLNSSGNEHAYGIPTMRVSEEEETISGGGDGVVAVLPQSLGNPYSLRFLHTSCTEHSPPKRNITQQY